MNLQKKIRLYYGFKFVQNAHFFGAVLVPFFTVWAGLTEQSVLQIQSFFLLSVSLLELPTGLIADRYGRKVSLVLGAVSAIIGLVLYGLYANIYLFLFSEAILALAMTFISGADEAWLIDTLNQHDAKERKAEIIGKGQSYMFTGMILGSLMGSWIAQNISLNATMYLSAIPALAMLLVVLKMPEPKAQLTESETFKWMQGILSLKEILKNSKLRTLSLNLILVAVSAYFAMWLYQPLLTKIGIDVVWFGVIHSLMIGMEILITRNFAFFEKKISISSYLILSAILTSVGFFLISWKMNLVTLLIFVLTAGSFGLSRRYIAIGRFHDFVSSTYRASISSSFSLLLRICTAVANIFIGWLFVRSVDVTLLSLGLLPLIAVVHIPLNNVFDKNK